jgi:heme exporter protein B
MFRTVLLKELKIVGKAKNGFFSLLTLILAFIFIFHFSLEKNNPMNMESIIGIKWAIIFLLSFIFIGQSIWEERESGALRINSVYVPAGIFFLIKSLVVFLILFIVNIFIIFLFYLFFSSMKISSFRDVYYQIIFLIPAGLSISFLGITLTQLSHATRLKEIILPVLLIPLSIPVLLFGMEAERNLILFTGNIGKPMIILLAFCVFYGALGILVQELTDDF